MNREDGVTPGLQAALDYLDRTSAAMAQGYVANCVTHACALADLLLRANRAPWIARLRLATRIGDRVSYAPLIPRRFTGSLAVTWNTHYVCCLDEAVYDPLLSGPVRIEDYCREVFGLDAALEPHLSPEATAELWRAGTLKEAFRPRPGVLLT